MKYAFFPGCVSRGGCPELYPAAVAVAEKLGLELEEMRGASCTGAGVMQEANLFLTDCLNARTFAQAQQMGLPIMNICSTCMGVMAQARRRLEDEEYRGRVNEVLSEEGLEYTGGIEVKHMLWVMLEDVGLERLRSLVVEPLRGLKVAPFYGCYIIRPTDALEYDKYPLRERSLELVIEAMGAESIDFSGKSRCCGFPILTINEKNSVAMVAKHTLDAKSEGADVMVTPCPLCHLNLDGFQPSASSQAKQNINMPILHLPQMVGLALGLDPGLLGLGRHIISTFDMQMQLGIRV